MPLPQHSAVIETEERRSGKRTILVGLDAACWEYLNPLLQSGKLPTLQNLMATGVSGVLRSTMPPWTPTAWASIITGKNPGKHGVFDMLSRRPGTYEFFATNSQVQRGTPFWKRLNDAGVRVGLVNVPFTYPLPQVDGFVVCGFGSPQHAEPIAFPESANQWVRTNYRDFSPVVDASLLANGHPDEVWSAERKQQQDQVRIAVDLCERHEIDVLIINLMFVDHANHKMPDMERVEEALIATDADLGDLIASFRPDNVLVISDHGANRVKGNFLLQAWLRDQGFYVQAERSRSERMGPTNWVLMEHFEKYQLPALFERFLRKASSTIIPVIPRNVTDRLWRWIEKDVPFAKEQVYLRDQPDFPHTTVFPGSIHSGLIYLNVLGREPDGIIEAGRRDAVLGELTARLRKLTDPANGKPLFTHIYRREEIYSGSVLERAPDLILDSYDSDWNIQLTGYHAVAQPVQKRYFVPGKDYGWHSRDGLFIFSGLDFKSGDHHDLASLMDIAPSILHLYGVAIPDDYDGVVLKAFFADTDCGVGKVAYQAGDRENEGQVNDGTLSEVDASVVADHLRALGYLE